MEDINEAKLRCWLFLIELKRVTIDEVPEPYKKTILDNQ